MKSAFFLAVFLSASAALLWMVAFPWAFSAKFERDTGCSFAASRVSCNPFGFAVHIEDAELGNHPDFAEGRSMMKVRSFDAEADFGSLMTDEVVVEKVSVDISRLTLVVDERGVLNLERLASDLFGESKGLGDGMRMTHCRLKVDTVEILDFSSPAPTHKALKLGVDVEDFEAEGAIGLFKPLMEIVIRSNYLPKDFSRLGSAEMVSYDH